MRHVTTSYRDHQGQRFYVLHFEGRLQSLPALQAADDMFGDLSTNGCPMVWDCSAMQGYDVHARQVWQQVLRELPPELSKVWLISDSSAIRQGAEIMSGFSGREIRPVRGWDEISA